MIIRKSCLAFLADEICENLTNMSVDAHGEIIASDRQGGKHDYTAPIEEYLWHAVHFILDYGMRQR